jgi:hypothetical protein
MPQRSKLELLGLVEVVVDLYFNKKKKQRDIVKVLEKQGYVVSRGSVQRAIKSRAMQLRELRKKQDWAETLVAATNKTPRLQIADAGLQIAAMKLLEEVSGIGGEDFKEMEPEKKVVLLTKVSRAIGLAANVELNFERGRKQGLLDGEKKFEDAAKEAGLDEKTFNFIKAKMIGIEVQENESV